MATAQQLPFTTAESDRVSTPFTSPSEAGPAIECGHWFIIHLPPSVSLCEPPHPPHPLPRSFTASAWRCCYGNSIPLQRQMWAVIDLCVRMCHAHTYHCCHAKKPHGEMPSRVWWIFLGDRFVSEGGRQEQNEGRERAMACDKDRRLHCQSSAQLFCLKFVVRIRSFTLGDEILLTLGLVNISETTDKPQKKQVRYYYCCFYFL